MVTHKKHHPLVAYHEDITDVTSRFTFTHHPVPDRSGLIISPQGFGQPFFHKPTNTVGVLFSKTANSLAGTLLDNGRRVMTHEQMEACYIFGARRLKGNPDDPLFKRPNIHTVQRDLRDDLDKARRELGLRSRKHFTLYNADNIYTNGRHVYEILPRKRGGFDVVFRMATRREDGGFVPFDMNDKSLRGIFSRATKVIEKTKTYEQAQQAVGRHWQSFSSELWSQRNIFVTQGKAIFAKKLASDLMYAYMDESSKVLGSTAIVGLILGMSEGPTLGVVGGLTVGFTAAVGHTAIHLPVEIGLKEYLEIRKKSREAKSKLDIDAYGYAKDVSDHFKIQTPENISKVCPHIDLERFAPEDFELLPLDQFTLQKDREMVQDNLQALSLSGHLLFMGQRGYSSQSHILDRRTELRTFQSGVTRLIHEREDGKIIVFGQYRPEMCADERLRLPECYIKQFEGRIVRLEYDRTKTTFTDGLPKGLEHTTYKDMINEIETDLLFSSQNIDSWDIRSKSFESIFAAFSNPDLGIKVKSIGASPRLAALA
ncbi:MAG: hypothetical protein PHX61_07270 [Alphaproteobacteria bacterium]|nr:hypothetical protein [Alphaproteobacteria bacterium]